MYINNVKEKVAPLKHKKNVSKNSSLQIYSETFRSGTDAQGHAITTGFESTQCHLKMRSVCSLN